MSFLVPWSYINLQLWTTFTTVIPKVQNVGSCNPTTSGGVLSYTISRQKCLQNPKDSSKWKNEMLATFANWIPAGDIAIHIQKEHSLCCSIVMHLSPFAPFSRVFVDSRSYSCFTSQTDGCFLSQKLDCKHSISVFPEKIIEQCVSFFSSNILKKYKSCMIKHWTE